MLNQKTSIQSLIFALFLFSSIITFAQQYKVQGTVVDAAGEPIPFASVSAVHEDDSLSSKSVMSSLDGEFLLRLNPGDYKVVISYFSFKTKTVSDLLVNENIDIGSIQLEPEAQQLDEVVIITEKNQMKLELDKRVYNVGENLVNAGANATDILENIPSVSVDVDGNISLRGSENVQVLIDGKPSGLIGSDLSGLTQIQGSMIEKVEIITNPSSRYDAQGGAGIINIVLKKERENGFNADFEVATGYPHRHQLSTNVNYRTKKLNVFAGVGVNYRKTPGEGNTYQTFNEDDSVFYYQKDNERIRSDKGFNVQLGTDVFLNKKNTLTIASTLKKSSGDNLNKNSYTDFDSNRLFAGQSIREEDELEKENLIEGSVRHEKTFKKKNHTWTNYVKMIESKDNENSSITQTFSLAPDSLLNQFSENLEREFNFLAQSDYVQPVGENGRVEVGLKSSIKEVENNFAVRELTSAGEENVLPAFNNDFKYNENIHAGYVQYGNKVKKVSYQIGLRSEYSDITTTLLKTNEVNNRTYLNFFPSLYLSTPVDSNSTLQWSYSRRISRPRSRHFLPFYTFNDNRNLRTGNPDLNPEYTNSFDLGYLRYLEKGSFLASVYYRHSTGVIQRITLSDSLGVTQTLPVNLATEHAVGLELTANYDLAKWWKTSTSLNLFDNKIIGSYNDYVLNRNTFGWRGQFSSKLNFNRKTVFQTMFNYMSPQNTPQGSRKSITSLDLAFSREVLNSRGTLVFGVRDVFNSRRWRSIVDAPTYYLESDYLRSKRQFTLTFTYHINPPKKKQNERLRNGGDGDMGDDDF